MKVYEVAKRDENLLGVSMCLVIGSLFILFNTLWVLGILTVNDKERPTTFEDYSSVAIGVLIGCFACYIGWRNLNHSPYEICIYDNGIVEFRLIRSSLTVNATDIHAMKKCLVDGEDGKFRELRIQHPHSWMTINDFTGLDELMTHLLSLNPAIVVEYQWTP